MGATAPPDNDRIVHRAQQPRQNSLKLRLKLFFGAGYVPRHWSDNGDRGGDFKQAVIVFRGADMAAQPQ